MNGKALDQAMNRHDFDMFILKALILMMLLGFWPSRSPDSQLTFSREATTDSAGELSLFIQLAATAPCDVVDPWVRWESGQVGI